MRARAAPGTPLLPAGSQALASIRRRLHSLSNVAAARTLSRRRLAVCSSSGRPVVAPARGVPVAPGSASRCITLRAIRSHSFLRAEGAACRLAERFASTRWSIFSARSTASSYSSMRYTGAGRAQVIGMRASCQRSTRLGKGRVETGTAPGTGIRTLRSARVQCMYAPRN